MRPAERYGIGRLRVCVLLISHCRAGPWPRRTLIILEIIMFLMFGGRERPPYRPAETGNEPGTPRGAHPCREAYMPPLQIGCTHLRGKRRTTPQTPTGRIHAAPTNRPGTAGKWIRRGVLNIRPFMVCMAFPSHCRGRMHAAHKTAQYCPF